MSNRSDVCLFVCIRRLIPRTVGRENVLCVNLAAWSVLQLLVAAAVSVVAMHAGGC